METLGSHLNGPFASLTEQVIGAAIEVQRALGPGLLESAYEACLAHELELRGLTAQRQVPLGITYRGLEIPYAFRMDLVIENTLVVELKTVEIIAPEHEAQMLSYLRFSGHPIGLILNFKAFPMGKKGIRRFLNEAFPGFSSVSSV